VFSLGFFAKSSSIGQIEGIERTESGQTGPGRGTGGQTGERRRVPGIAAVRGEAPKVLEVSIYVLV
jgi:hypothetical protein